MPSLYNGQIIASQMATCSFTPPPTTTTPPHHHHPNTNPYAPKDADLRWKINILMGTMVLFGFGINGMWFRYLDFLLLAGGILIGPAQQPLFAPEQSFYGFILGIFCIRIFAYTYIHKQQNLKNYMEKFVDNYNIIYDPLV